VHRYTMSNQSGGERLWPGQVPGRMMRRVCTGTPVHYEQPVRGRVAMARPGVRPGAREEDTASVYGMTKCVKPLGNFVCQVVPFDQSELSIWTT
jgi:hypothetical protein